MGRTLTASRKNLYNLIHILQSPHFIIRNSTLHRLQSHTSYSPYPHVAMHTVRNLKEEEVFSILLFSVLFFSSLLRARGRVYRITH